MTLLRRLSAIFGLAVFFLFWLTVPFFVFEIWSRNAIILDWRLAWTLFAPAYAGFWVVILLHEFGHFAAARMFGMPVEKFVVGRGPGIHFTAAGIAWHFRLLATEGYVCAGKGPARSTFHKLAFFAAAGLILQLGLALGMVVVLSRLPPFAASVGSDRMIWYLGITLLFYSVMTAVKNIVPSHSKIDGQTMASDGLTLLGLWRVRTDLPRLFAEREELEAIFSKISEEESGAAAEKLEIFCEQNPQGARSLADLGQQLFDEGKPRLARMFLESALRLEQGKTPERAAILDSLTSLVLYRGLSHWLEDAEQWIREAREIAPDQITLNGSYGAVLAERGQAAEARSVLTKVFNDSEASLDKAISAAYLAKLANGSGKHAEAKSWLARANDIDPEHPVIKRVSAECALEEKARQK